MDNEWKKSLRERFQDYSAPEPEGLWEGIEQGIAGKARRSMLPVWLASGAAIAAAVALVVFLHPEKTLETPDLQKQSALAESVQAAPVVTDAADASSPVLTTPSSPAPTTPSSPAPTGDPVPFAVASRQTLLSEAAPVVSVPVSEETVPDAVNDRHSRLDRESAVEQEASVTEKDETCEMPDQVGHDGPVGHDDPVGQDDRVGQDDQVPARTRNRFSVGAYSGGGQTASEASRGIGMNRTGAYMTRGNNYGAPPKVGDLVNMLSNNRSSSFEAKHGAPVRTGVTLAWELTRHLSLSTGLNWTSLTSTFEESTSATNNRIRQNLGYLGIPLRLEVGFEPVNRLRLYAGAGGMVEKGLLASAKTESYIGDHLEDVMKSHPDTGGLLWSLGASAGAEFRFNQMFGLYVAPGIEYHFDNGADVSSAYTEKPLHWNLSMGVRFNFGN